MAFLTILDWKEEICRWETVGFGGGRQGSLGPGGLKNLWYKLCHLAELCQQNCCFFYYLIFKHLLNALNLNLKTIIDSRKQQHMIVPTIDPSKMTKHTRYHPPTSTPPTHYNNKEEELSQWKNGEITKREGVGIRKILCINRPDWPDCNIELTNCDWTGDCWPPTLLMSLFVVK